MQPRRDVWSTAQLQKRETLHRCTLDMDYTVRQGLLVRCFTCPYLATRVIQPDLVIGWGINLEIQVSQLGSDRAKARLRLRGATRTIGYHEH